MDQIWTCLATTELKDNQRLSSRRTLKNNADLAQHHPLKDNAVTKLKVQTPSRQMTLVIRSTRAIKTIYFTISYNSLREYETIIRCHYRKQRDHALAMHALIRTVSVWAVAQVWTVWLAPTAKRLQITSSTTTHLPHQTSKWISLATLNRQHKIEEMKFSHKLPTRTL